MDAVPTKIKNIYLHLYISSLCAILTSKLKKEEVKHIMARNKVLVPEAKQDLDNFKMEVARSLNVNLKQGYNGDIKARDAGSVGGEMVKRMIQYAESNMNGGNNMMR